MQIPAFLTRHALGPTLRLVRDRLAAHPDYRELRKWAARADRAYRKEPQGARSTAVLRGDVKATWIDAKGARKDRAILYLHGGAFIVETPGIHAALVARIGAQAQARALMPSYRLAPEFPCPAALDDCMAAYRFLLDDGFEAADIALVGDSAGGNLALGLLLRARDEGLPLPAGAVVMSPVTDGTLSGDSLRRNVGHDALFAPSLFHDLLPLYLPDASLRTHPHVSPLHGDLQGLPPILMLVGSTELLLDDSVRFASKCRSATLEVWHDMPHVFPLFDFLPEAVDATQRIGRFLRECFALSHARSAGVAGSEAIQPPQVDALRRSPPGLQAQWPSPATRERTGAHSVRAQPPEGVTETRDGPGFPSAAEAGVDPAGATALSRHALREPGCPTATAAFTPRAWLYLGLALLAAAAGIAPFMIGPSALGAAPGGLLAALLPGAGQPGIEAWLGTAALAVFAQASASRIGRWRAAMPVLGALLLGAVAGLALLLFEHERKR